jgi:hypothetical protein
MKSEIAEERKNVAAWLRRALSESSTKPWFDNGSGVIVHHDLVCGAEPYEEKTVAVVFNEEDRKLILGLVARAKKILEILEADNE